MSDIDLRQMRTQVDKILGAETIGPTGVAVVLAYMQAENAQSNDDEHLHGVEDRLRRLVLATIAGGYKYADELAAAALKTSDFKFSRWCS